MEQLGEDPKEFERLHQSLRSAISPRDGFEELLVEEMAVNRWRLARLRRAEMGTLMCERLKLVARKFELETGAPTMDSASLGMFGLAGAESSPQKFSEILELLETLRTKVENEGFTDQGLELLKAIYGYSPDVPGASLIAKFKAEMNDNGLSSDDEDDAEAQANDDDDPTGSETAGTNEGDEDADEESEPDPAPSGAGLGDENDEVAEAEPACAGGEQGEDAVNEHALARSSAAARRAEARQNFLDSLDREMESFAKLGITDALVRKTPIPQAAQDACLIPFKDNLAQMLPYETMLQREFERLQKQLREWRESNSEPRPGRPRKRRG
jgi:hypothetical protein